MWYIHSPTVNIRTHSIGNGTILGLMLYGNVLWDVCHFYVRYVNRIILIAKNTKLLYHRLLMLGLDT